ncbi:uncharacterized protein LOC125465839 isoform X1 [Stegostoma tigrinum]|uniref:uncharacterized protein LOC125465839 isoform X1 n=1 Tax=Stegostoma tigrinum TaxID=3053191 RepID=UPI00202AF5F7|nr:uncharacterized protein LOC125465839 isoform X1 [Stegostoma tigrinum]
MQPARPSQLSVNLCRRICESGASTPGSKLNISSMTSPQCSELQQEVMAEELLKLMNFAASKIQALWRGYCTRKQVCIEQGAAILLQSFWRGYQVRKLLEPVSRPLPIHVKQPAFWVQCQEQQRLLEAGQVHIQSRHHWRPEPVQLHIEKSPVCTSTLQRKIRAATTIQAHWRGYLARRDLAIKIGAAVYIQSFFRGYLVRRNLKANSEPTIIPQDEEAEMVDYNMSYTPGFTKSHAAIHSSPHRNSSSILPASGSRRVSSTGSRSTENASRPYSNRNYCPFGKGDTVQGTKPRRFLSWCPDSGEENCLRTVSAIQMDQDPKINMFVPGFLIEGAGDTTSMSGHYNTIQTQAEFNSPKERSLNQMKSEKWQKHQNMMNQERSSNILGITAARPRYSYKSWEKVEGESEVNKTVSQYLVKCTPCTSNKVRKLIRYTEELTSESSSSDRSSSKPPISKQDFNLSELETSRQPSPSPSKSSGRKTLKQVREENAAASTIQAVWKGLCTRRLLRQQVDAATKIQAIFRSYRIRKEFENEGIFPLVYTKESNKHVRKSPGTRPEAGCEKPGAETTNSPLADPWDVDIGSELIDSKSESFRQPSQRRETGRRKLPTVSLISPPCVPETGVIPGREGGKPSHPLQRTIQTRKRLQDEVKAARTIQAVWRGYKARCEIQKQREAAVKIQALFRGFQIRRLLCSIGRQEEDEDQNGSTEGASWAPTGDSPDYLYLMAEAVSGPDARESPSNREQRSPLELCCHYSSAWRGQAKPDGAGIFVKRNPCYNPRKVTIHVKAAGGDMS